jgi:glucokinase
MSAAPIAPPALAVDLGGTNVRAAAVMPDGQIVARRHLPTRAHAGLQEVLDRIAEAVSGVATDARVPADAPVGLVLPGAVNPYTGFLSLAPNLGWRDVPIRDLLQERLGRPIALGNDVNGGALGEWRYGEGQGTRHLVFLACGTGVGGGIVVDGRLLLGKDGLAAECGHMVVQIDGPRCHCGGRGCLEAFASGWAIEETAQELLDRGLPSILPELMESRGEALSGALINYAAAHDDGLALEVLSRAGRALGFAVASLVHTFNPEVVAIGGGVIAAGPFLFDPMHEAIDEHLIKAFADGLRVVPSALGQDAGLLGAAVLATDLASTGHP